MSFIDADEFIILMDMPTINGREFSHEELVQLRKAGIRTAWLHGLDWDAWREIPGYLSKRIARVRAAGMKALVPLWCWQSSDLNEEFYSRSVMGTGSLQGNGRYEYVLSPWNVEAQRAYNQTLARVKRDYEAEDVQIVSIYFRAGESVMPVDARYFDLAALADWRGRGHTGKPDHNTVLGQAWIRERYTQMILEQQRICIDSPWREAWFGYHLPKQGRPNCGVDWIEDYFRAIQAECKPMEINHITFTYFANYPGLPEKIEHLKTTWNSAEWAGAEYCEGLRDGNAERAIAAGLRGLIVAPCHPLTRHDRLEPWMVEEIGQAIQMGERTLNALGDDNGNH